jgi:hypothetical protein
MSECALSAALQLVGAHAIRVSDHVMRECVIVDCSAISCMACNILKQ